MIGRSLRTAASDGSSPAGTGPPAVSGRADADEPGEGLGAPDDPVPGETPGPADGPALAAANGSIGRTFGSSDGRVAPGGSEASAAAPTLTARSATTRLVVPARARV